ncbi:zinc-alpha-2-glycoprotein-like isoform X2 [Colossoma macropomum]|uniref:zinc-alpha-2-glycoprotein-like isoform X2 n=1 Tax=Colossoma macropomum TaxID=42526 RepID=UPI0018656238|nr:zinc-alpha-2-glycoprotein-like isoform X2 [Colossoma macropomum]
MQTVAKYEHSLCYLYTVQSKSSSDRVSEFSAVTLLDDRQIDSYSSTDGIRTPKQDWMKEMKESEWKDSIEKLKSDKQQLKKDLDKHMKAFKHKESDGHILQSRVGCEGEKHSDGSVSLLNCTNEYGYDGQTTISYNWTSSKWSTSVIQAKALAEEWNAGRGPNAVQRCEECDHWLKIYSKYNTTETKQTQMDVHVFVTKRVTDLRKVNLTCMGTGFYPKDVKMSVRQFTTSLPEHLLRSSGVRPNEDGTYQLRKSVEINEDDAANYNCYMNHSSLDTPVFKQWDEKCSNCHYGLSGAWIVGVTVGVVALLAVLGGIIYVCIKKRKSRGSTAGGPEAGSGNNLLGRGHVYHCVSFFPRFLTTL